MSRSDRQIASFADSSWRALRVAVVGICPDNVHYQTYVRHLLQCGHDVTVITDAATMDAPVEVLDYTASRRTVRLLPRGVRLIPRLARMRRYLRGGFDVLNVQQMTPDGVYAALLWKGALVLDFWGSDIHRLSQQHWLARRLMPRALQRATAIHSVSEGMTRALVEQGADPARIHTFQYGVDLDVFHIGAQRSAEPLIVSSRGARPFYRVETLIRAMPSILLEHPQARLVCSGPGDQGSLQAVADELGVTASIDFVGMLPPEKLADLLRAAWVWVSLPPTDGAPLSLMEAMACGALPVLADIPAVREWVDADRAVLLPEIAPEGLALAVIEGLVRSLQHKHEAPNRAVVSARADRSVNLPRWERLLRDAAMSGRGDAQ